MQTLISYYKSILVAIVLLSTTQVYAEHAQTFGHYDVHYIALPSTFIKPDIAKQYQIQRSKYNGLINISILDNKDNNIAQQAKLSGYGKNLLGQTTQLTFNEVKEGKAIYYLAQYPFSNEEIVHFHIKFTVNGQSNTLTFRHKFYVE